MRFRKMAALGLTIGVVAASATALSATAGSDMSRATGGGQVELGTRGGAGDTIAFTAQNREGETGNFATGQVQYVDRTAAGQTVLHGLVECLQVNDNVAKLAGEFRDGSPFQVIVKDNGHGPNPPDTDMIAIQQEPVDCSQDNTDGNLIALARGNAEVYETQS